MNERQALVTGCARGLGRSVVLLLKAQGYKVIGISRSQISDLDHELRGALDDYCQMDLSDGSAVQEFLSIPRKIDCLVVNASSRRFRDFHSFSDAEILSTVDGDFTNQLRILHSCLVYMKQQNRGEIILISSRASVVSYSTGSMYCGVKAAWRSLFYTLLKELKPTGVKVFLFVPDAFSSAKGLELPGNSRVLRRLKILIESLHQNNASKVFLALSIRSRIELIVYRIKILFRHAF